MKRPLKIFGLFFGWNVFGNTFTPAITIESRPKAGWKTARAIVTLRTKGYEETTAYWGGGMHFWWNSDHLARWLGEFEDTDFGGYYRWDGGRLGVHWLM